MLFASKEFKDEIERWTNELKLKNEEMEKQNLEITVLSTEKASIKRDKDATY